jgi:AcrR family transcriptional regulator
MTTVTSEAVRQPQQKRSQDTLERLLQAAEAVLAEVPLDEARVSEIVRRSGTSVGAFYGRFADKEALLNCLDDRFFQRARQYWNDFFTSADWREGPLDQRLSRLVKLVVAQNRAHRPLVRSLQLYAWLQPDSQYAARREKLQGEVIAEVCKTILARRRELTHPRPARAARLGLGILIGAVGELVLFSPTPLGEDALAAELTRALLAYLGLRQSWHRTKHASSGHSRKKKHQSSRKKR